MRENQIGSGWTEGRCEDGDKDFKYMMRDLCTPADRIAMKCTSDLNHITLGIDSNKLFYLEI
jgi:hypothetical protein